MAEAKASQKLLCPQPRVRRIGVADKLGQQHILGRSEIGQPVVELIDEPQLFAPHAGPVAAVQPLALFAADDYLAIDTAFEPTARLTTRGRSGAGRPQQSDSGTTQGRARGGREV